MSNKDNRERLDSDESQTLNNLERFMKIKNNKDSDKVKEQSKKTISKDEFKISVDLYHPVQKQSGRLSVVDTLGDRVNKKEDKSYLQTNSNISSNQDERKLLETKEKINENEIFDLLNNKPSVKSPHKLIIIDEINNSEILQKHTALNRSQDVKANGSHMEVTNQVTHRKATSIDAIPINKKEIEFDKHPTINDSTIALDNESETSVFFKNDYFRKDGFYTDKENKSSIKNELLIKDRMIQNYQQKKDIALPKFIKTSYRKTKMAEILTTKIMDPIRKAELYYDKLCCLNFRKIFIKYMNIISYYCYSLVSQKWFDNLSLIVIIINTILILISDPKDDNSIANTSDNYFLYLYTVEMFLKIFAYGFVISENSYIRDTWNILDFVVIVLGWISTILESLSNGSSVKGISGLRAFRILRPLKTVKSIKGLRNLIVTILESVGKLGDIAIILFFSFLIFSIAGVQMWQGLFMYRCFNNNYGYIDSFNDWSTSCTFDADCSDFSSPGNYYTCRKSYFNPFNNVLNFDNTLNGLITVYTICTMEGWTDMWGYVSKTFKDANGINLIIIFLYFHVLLFICGYFLINLCLAVIMTYFTEIKDRVETKPKKTLRNLHNLYEEKKQKVNLVEDENFDLQLEKIKQEVGGIEKGEIPLTYYTLKDIYRLYNDTPQNIDKLKEKIMTEAKKAMKEYKNKELQLIEQVKLLKKEISLKNTEYRINKMLTTRDTVYGGIHKIDTYSEEILKESIQDTLEYIDNVNNKIITNSPKIKKIKTIKRNKKRNDLSFIQSEHNVSNPGLNDFNDDANLIEKDSFDLDGDNDEANGGSSPNEKYFENKDSFPTEEDQLNALSEEKTRSNFMPKETMNSVISLKKEKNLNKNFKFSFKENLFRQSFQRTKNITSLESLHNGATTIKVHKRSKSQERREKIEEYNSQMYTSEKTKLSHLFINQNNFTEKRSNSITRSKWKFPDLDKYRKAEIADKSNIVLANHVSSFRKYMSYTFNLLGKDLAVKDDFKVNLNLSDVLNHPDYKNNNNNSFKKITIDREDAIRFFNTTRLYNYEYNSYNKYNLADDEFIHIDHQLKYLTQNIIEKVGYRTNKSLEGGKSIKYNSSASNSSLPKSVKSSSTSTNLSNLSNPSKKISSTNSVLNPTNSQKKKLISFDRSLYLKIDNMNFVTFDHYFDNEEKIYQSIPEYVPKDEEVINVRQLFDIKREVEKIRQYDSETGVIKHVEWSAAEILKYDIKDDSKYASWNEQLKKLQSFDIVLWRQNWFLRLLQKIRFALHYLSVVQWFDFFIIVIVIINSIIMALDGNMLDPDTLDLISNVNYAFNSIYILEFIVKFIGLGPMIYFSDPSTYLDVLIIGFAILDMATNSDDSGSAVSSKLAFLRVFRIFRVIRLMKVLRKIKTMRLIISGISESMANVGYVVLIMIMFILIFQLLGMSLLNNVPEYSNFMSSFYTTFNLVTLENWNSLLVELSHANRATALFLIVWIFIGAYILFNLFISILLSSFDGFGENDIEIEFSEKYPHLFQQYELAEYEYHKKLEKNKKKKEDLSDKIEEEADEDKEMGYSDMINIDGVKKDKNQFIYEWQLVNTIFKDNFCERSLYVFSQTNKLRLYCMSIITWKKFEQFIMLVILVSTLRLMIDTFVDGYNSSVVFDILDIIFTLIFICEMTLKIISLGFALDEGSYLNDNWNRIDFIIVIVSLIDLENLVNKFSGQQAGSGALGFLKVLRLLRTLRPLRFISKNVQLKLIITSLFDSIEAIMGVLAIVLVIFYAFSIVGMNLFYDLYMTCYLIVEPYNMPVLDFKDQLVKNGIDTTNNLAILNYVSLNFLTLV
jgi:hypothetical protein